MARTEIAGFPPKAYKTLRVHARTTVTFQNKINGMRIVQAELSKLLNLGNNIGGVFFKNFSAIPYANTGLAVMRHSDREFKK
jgi:hypothetical protein